VCRAARTSCRCCDAVKDYVSLGEISDVYRQSSASTGTDHLLGDGTMSDAIRIVKAATNKPKPKDSELASETSSPTTCSSRLPGGEGLVRPAVEPYGRCRSSGRAVLHYAQAIFDGLKRSGRGRQGPPLPSPEARRAAEQLRPADVHSALDPTCPSLARDPGGIERDWVPKTVGTSLYVRPTIIASEAFLGVRPPSRTSTSSSSPPWAPTTRKGCAVKIRVEEKRVRAVEAPGAPNGRNYAASLMAAKSQARGFTSVVARRRAREYIDEVGTMKSWSRSPAR